MASRKKRLPVIASTDYPLSGYFGHCLTSVIPIDESMFRVDHEEGNRTIIQNASQIGFIVNQCLFYWLARGKRISHDDHAFKFVLRVVEQFRPVFPALPFGFSSVQSDFKPS